MRRIVPVAAAIAAVSLACGPRGASDRLARTFPQQAARVLDGERFAKTRAGFASPAAPRGPGWRVDRIAAALAARDGLRITLPPSGREPVVLAHPAGLRVELRELGAARGAALEARGAVAYEGPTSTSYWAATAEGYEQWILVEDAGPRAVAEWEVRGGKLRAQAEAVEVLDASGAPRLRVTAPAAFREDGTPARAWLAVSGNRLSLHTDARGVALVDPLWTAVGSIAGGRGFHTATPLGDGTLLVAGGFGSGTAGPLASAALYDPADQAWTATGALGTRRYDHTATLLANGKVLVAGGIGVNAAYLNSTELYDPATRTWSPGPPMSAVRSHHTASRLPDGRVVVAGGADGVGGDGVGTLSGVEIYDPVANGWTTAASMQSPRAGHAAAVLPNGKVLVSGGEDIGPLDSAELYDPASGTWTLTGSLGAFRSEHAQTLLADGKVLVSGGWDGTDVFATAELYDPSAGTWAPTGALGTARRYHVATLLPSGEVLVTGGDDGSGPLASTELYGPGTETWTATEGPLATPRYYHTATLLAGGDVLVAFGASPAFVDSAERYQPPASTPTWRPVVSTFPAAVMPGGDLALTGTMFTGVSEGSSGRTQASASSAPAVRLVREGGAAVGFCRTRSFSATGVTAVVPASATPGPHLVSVVANGVESEPVTLLVIAPIAITPSATTSPPSGTVQLVASGGSGGYLWTLVTNSSGATVDSNGLYRAGSRGGSTDVVAATDSLGNVATSTVTVGPGLSISPTSASVRPGGAVAFTAEGGSGTAFTWSLDASPSGGSIDPATGEYTAGPTGGVTDVVKVMDSLLNQTTREVTVTASTGPLAISPASPAVAPRGSIAFATSGGTGAGTWSIPTNASGATITASGVYTAGDVGSVSDVVRFTDTESAVAEATVTVTGSVAIAPATASTPPRGSVAFTVIGGSGLGYAWTLATSASGAANITSDGVYTAGPVGGVTDVVRVTDSLGNTTTRDVAVGPGVSIAPPSGPVRTGQSLTLVAQGGDGTYSWSIPVNESGGSVGIGGTYTAGGTPGTDTVRVTDSLGNFATIDVVVTVPPQPLSVSPTTSAVDPGGTVTLTASGGSGSGYTWALTQNESGATLGATTGVSIVYTAGSTGGGAEDYVRVVDSLGNDAYALVTVGAPPPLVNISPAVATVEAGDTLTFTATGGTGPYTWSMVLGPSGGTITADGVYTAGPTWPAVDVVKVVDQVGNAATREVDVTEPIAPLVISPATASAPPRGAVSFSATGGTGSYTWSISPNRSGGTITAAGVYTAGTTGSVTDVVQVRDSAGTIATRDVAVTAGLAVVPAMASVARTGSLAFTATGGSGTGYAWSLDASPSGGTITAGGAYTAGAIGGVTDVVRVTDSLGNTATRNVTVTVTALVITPASAEVTTRASIPFAVSGGSGTGYVWSLATNASGGGITAAGFYTAGITAGTDVVRVVDSAGGVATATVTVSAPPPDGGGGGGGGGCGSGGGGGWLSLPLLVAATVRRRRARAARPPSGA